MKDEKLIVKQVYDAKHDMQLADEFIWQYLPFINRENKIKQPAFRRILFEVNNSG